MQMQLQEQGDQVVGKQFVVDSQYFPILCRILVPLSAFFPLFVPICPFLSNFYPFCVFCPFISPFLVLIMSIFSPFFRPRGL